MPSGIYQRTIGHSQAMSRARLGKSRAPCSEQTKQKISESNSNKADDFWKKVNILTEDECWEWMGRMVGGYGAFDYMGKGKLAHRLSFQFTYNCDIGGEDVTHICNNPKCCNPKHLKLGTHKENMEYMVKCGRSFHPYGELSNNSKLTSADVIEIRRLSEVNHLSNMVISKLYNITRENIWNIVTRKTWRHI
jgi:hypothetical protein